MAIRILIVDDHKILRQGLRSLLEHESDMQVVGEADDGRVAIDLAHQLHPDVVLMDISLPGINGVDATRLMLEEHPAARILALTAHSNRTMVREILKNGAMGYLLKDSAVEELVQAVRTIMSGRVYLSSRIAGIVVEGFVSDPDETTGGVFARLTAREREVLQLMSEGKATKEVARALQVSIKTAETHRRAIMEKLNIHSVAELTKYAIREGLTTVD